MKFLLLAAALLSGSAAHAQSTAPVPNDAGAQTVAPGNDNPERDARGIAVISDPATAPAGFNQAPAVGGTGADASQRPAPQPATETYRACSRTVTDNCVQTYERGRSPQN